jgi:putative salt-induced outer membrane protein YdiY
MLWILRASALILAAASASLPLQARVKKDIVVMKNGDTLTGEVKALVNGMLAFKADYMADTVQLDWNQIATIKSSDQFSVVFSDGTRNTGMIIKKADPPKGEGGFLIEGAEEEMAAPSQDVITINQVEDTFLHQLTGSISYGLTYTGGTSSTQSNFATDVSYRSERWYGKLDASSVFSRQNDAKPSGRNTVDLYYYNYRGERWFAAGTASFLSSRQQDLSGRTTLGAGIGMDLIRRTSMNLQFVGGALFRNEVYAPSVGSVTVRGTDAQLLLQFTKYTFTKFQFTTGMGIFPSLSDLGRVRFGLNSSLKKDLARNLTLIYTLYENFDSRPPVPAPKNDFGTTLSVGWTF